MRKSLLLAIVAAACGGTENPAAPAPPRPLLSCTIVIATDGSCVAQSACTCAVGAMSAGVSFDEPISNATVTRIWTYPVQASFYQGSLQELSSTDYTLTWTRPDGTPAPAAELGGTQWYVQGEK
jgi:hypothetical protein